MIFKELGLKTQADATGSDLFGTALSANTEGDLFVVGASGHSSDRGAVYVYRRNSEGDATLLQKITASDSQEGDRFGQSLHLSASGDVLAVGAPYCSSESGRTLHGAVYVYFWNGSSFSNEFKVIPNGGSSPEFNSLNDTFFGHALALSDDGSILVVGNDAEYEDGCIVYIYSKSGNTFSFLQSLANPRTDAYVSKFGKAIAVDQTAKTIIVGAPDLAALGSVDFSIRTGGGFIFTRNQNYSLNKSIYFSETNFEFRGFGASVAVNWDGSIYGFGAPDTASFQGVVAIFSNTTEIEEPADFFQQGFLIEPSNPQPNLGFGAKIQFDRYAHRLMVGMFGSANTVGEIWMYELFPNLDRGVTSQIAEQIWEVSTPSPNQSGQRFGSSICLSRNGLIAFAGSPNYDSNGGFYVYKSRVNTRHFSHLYDRVNQNDENNPTAITENENDFLDQLIFLNSVTKVAQKLRRATLHPSSVVISFGGRGDILGNALIEIRAGDAEAPFDTQDAVLSSVTLPVASLNEVIDLPVGYIFENDHCWLVISVDSTYLSAADEFNYLALDGSSPAKHDLPFLKYSGAWEAQDFSILYSFSTEDTFAGVGEFGRLTTRPFDVGKSIYTTKPPPYRIYGGEKLTLEKNGFLKQNLTLPTPAVAGQMTQQELVDFLNSNLSARFKCFAVAQNVDGKPAVVIINDDLFTKNGVTEATGFVRVSTEWDLGSNGTVSTNDALAFSDGATLWSFKPDRLASLNITQNTIKSEWYDWFESVHRPLHQVHWSNHDVSNGLVTVRPKLGIHPLSGGWNLRSLFTFIVNNFILNPQTKKVRNSVGEEITVNLDVDKNHINVVLISFAGNTRYLSAFWYY
jgi:hypothetical protein